MQEIAAQQASRFSCYQPVMTGYNVVAAPSRDGKGLKISILP
jgi:hypothetical protein